MSQEKLIKWRDHSNRIPEENLLIAAGLRDRLRMTSAQIADFLENYMGIPGASGRGSSLKANLTKARSKHERPYDQKISIEPGSEDERLCFQIIEERTGLMAPDIEALYGLHTPKYKRHVDTQPEREKWTEEKLTVLGGLLVYCCNGDQRAAMSYMVRWLGIQDKEKYGRASLTVGNLKRRHEFLRAYLETEDKDDTRRQEFERLLRSKPETSTWTISGIKAEYDKGARIDWSGPENQFLWAGLIRYCGLSWKQAMRFLEIWFERELKTDADGDYRAPYGAMYRNGRTMQDVAPIASPETEKRTEEFREILKKKGWTIESVRAGAQEGVFSAPAGEDDTESEV